MTSPVDFETILAVPCVMRSPAELFRVRVKVVLPIFKCKTDIDDRILFQHCCSDVCKFNVEQWHHKVLSIEFVRV